MYLKCSICGKYHDLLSECPPEDFGAIPPLDNFILPKPPKIEFNQDLKICTCRRNGNWFGGGWRPGDIIFSPDCPVHGYK